MCAWENDQKWELDWHGNCANSYGEETKQLGYVKGMGLKWTEDHRTPYNIDLQGKSVVDIGGGAYSLLIKAVNFKRALVVDPAPYPEWVYARYKACGIDSLQLCGEDFVTDEVFDEGWIYNVLQHTKDPERVARNIRKCTKIVRVFDYLEIGIAPGHPHNLTEDNMNEWFGGIGQKEKGRVIGYNYWGIFKGDHFENSSISS